MTLYTHVFSVCSAATAIALYLPALAEPVQGSLSTAERPLGDLTTQPQLTLASYGLCSAPQNADAFPSIPVPVEPSRCHNSQRFSATSNTPSTGGSCGGFTVAFGPLGDLRPHLDGVTLAAEWGDVALTAANCASARLAAVGWGARCSDDACTSAQWEKIGGPPAEGDVESHEPGVLPARHLRKCRQEVQDMLNIDIIATVVENGEAVRKRAKGTITVRRAKGKCYSVDESP